MKKIIGLFCFLFVVSTVFAQQLDHSQGQIIVQLQENIKAEDWIKSGQTIDGQASGLRLKKTLSNRINAHLLEFDYNTVNEEVVLRYLNTKRGIIHAQFNHFVEMRAEPNDPQFSSQWQYINTGQGGGTVGADIDADLAWDITTGGVTITGDTIVVAVLDDGIDIDHEDIQANLWRNHEEIPNNNIDDDGNGYVDDYLGWSIITDDDNIAGGGHGTPVAGIVGADGDNGIGVAGMSWNVKVMVIKNNFNTQEAAVIEAYSYALEQRMSYNETGGDKGAFVVSTNASWGIDGGNPADSPIWCDFYNTLGEAGILSCGATANANTDVDVEGDLPTACDSDYLISVTNMNRNDVKVTNAGYGLETIDLGAFGAQTFTLANNNSYGPFGGTSGATPHVAGAVGLLYSLPCPSLMALAQSDPGAAVLAVKEAILNGTDANASLEGITVTGGRLNVRNSMDLLLVTCDGCIPAASVALNNVTDEMAELTWMTNDSLLAVDVRWRAVDAAEWNLVEDATSPLVFDSLMACTDYEYQIQSICAMDTIEFNNSIVFRTDGCCLAPSNIMMTDLTENTVSFEWGAILAAQGYEVAYREVGLTDWSSVVADTVFTTIEELTTCTTYEYRLRTICATDTTDWTMINSFTTKGCGACLDLEYCVPEDLNNSDEFIQQVEIGSVLNNSSTADSEAYVDYGSTVPFVELEQGGTYFTRLTPGFTGQTYTETWTVWLDANQDGVFADNERLFVDNVASSDVKTTDLLIPTDAVLGVTRMRILMRFSAIGGPCEQTPAGGDAYGEAEDYCVNIVEGMPCINPTTAMVNTVGETTAEISWDAVGGVANYEVGYRLATASNWTTTEQASNMIVLDNLTDCVDYEFRVKSLCGAQQSDGYITASFTTDCINSTKEITQNGQSWRAMPNPVSTYVNIEWTAATAKEDLSVAVYDALGKQVVGAQVWTATASNMQLDLSVLPAGVYTVNLVKGNQLWSAKRIVKID